MGLWSRLTGKTKHADGSQNVTPAPDSPAQGEITSFDAADGIGRITLDGGTQIRFGHSACKGFEPILSARVEVISVGSHPLGGHRATKVVPASGTVAELDQLHDQRANQHGLGDASHAEAVASACSLGTVTILLRKAPEQGRAGVRSVFDAAEVLTDGVGLDFAPSPILKLGRRDLQIFVGREPFPRSELDRRVSGDDFDLGDGFISLSTGLADLDESKRYILGESTPDAWAMDGELRILSKVALRLLSLGTGIVVHRAGQVVYPAQHWTRLLGDLDDPACRPFGAWTDIGFSDDRKQLKCWGMSVSSHHDVAVEFADHESDDEYIRARCALLLACSRMVHENRQLSEGETVEVPWGIEVGALPVVVRDSARDATTTTYELVDEGFVLRPKHVGASLAEQWQRVNSGANEPLSFAAYKELFLSTLKRDSGFEEIASMDFDDIPAELPEHEAIVFQRGDGNFAVVTCGLGRICQPNGAVVDDTAHVEFMVVVSEHHPNIAVALSYLGRYFHGRDEDAPPWEPEHRISFDEPLGPARSFALGFIGNVELEHGPPITLLGPTAMTDREHESISVDSVPEWLAEHGNDIEVRDRWLEFARSA